LNFFCWILLSFYFIWMNNKTERTTHTHTHIQTDDEKFSKQLETFVSVQFYFSSMQNNKLNFFWSITSSSCFSLLPFRKAIVYTRQVANILCYSLDKTRGYFREREKNWLLWIFSFSSIILVDSPFATFVKEFWWKSSGFLISA